MTAPSPVDEASRCMKCGFCMAACPVYNTDHIESHVARGRNMLVLFTNRQEVPADDSYQESLSHCLLCGRCQATCPAKVPSAAITAQARAQLVSAKGLTGVQRFIYRGILKNRPRVARLLGIAARLPGMANREGKPLRHLADFATYFSRGLAIPRLASPFLGKRVEARTSPPQGVAVRGRVAVFPGCAYEFFFADIGQDIIRSLAESGFEVAYVPELTCCGLAVYSAGDVETARLMAQKNIEALLEFDQVVTGCATCSSALKTYGEWFSANSFWHERAQSLAAKASDFSDFLVREHVQLQKVHQPMTVTYHDPCHLRWHQSLNEPPRRILSAIKGVTLVEMEGADTCCGLGGSFGIIHRDVSLAIQARKMEAIRNTNARAVVTSCPGCMIQLMDGARRHDMRVNVLHIAQVIQGRLDG